MIRRPPRSTLSSSSAASDVYKRQAKLALKRAERSTAWAKSTLQDERQKHAEYRAEAAKTIRSLCNQLLSASVNQSGDEDQPLMFVPEMRQMVTQHAQLMERLESVAPMQQELHTAEQAVAQCKRLESELNEAREEEFKLEAQLREAKRAFDLQQVGLVTAEQADLQSTLREELDRTEKLQESTYAQLQEAKSFLSLRSKFDLLNTKSQSSRGLHQRLEPAVLKASTH
eukprot:TRINITY_DN15300_c0_g1_i2.p1 TRINITY_DN15300_c0_g1~~TRINITY_DN15300_c0_g1_i2.p1  ORF type:complete len:228 (-),score=81.26 TRINITY_DN15300_c0_g1_i2:375-1058(-)